ncbi:DUF1214 domain-containing protein [Hydrocarboniphaga effusa]|uniref:DUF1214 domain-containing protein n=1 Tax=Hydrocarboniphaga effusa TaxID=243629 RepID=UPI00398BDA72
MGNDSSSGPLARQTLAAAWQSFADDIASGASIVSAAPFANDPRDLAEGHRYLARLIAFAIQEEFGFADPEFPAFHRGLDPLAPWGAPNVDNIYLTATIDGRSDYRVWADVSTIDGFILNTNEGVFPIFPGFKTTGETSSRDLVIGEDGHFELLLSAERPADWKGNWMRLTPADSKFSVRQYLSDWDRHLPADFHIVKLGNEGLTPAPLTPERCAKALADAVHWAKTLAAYYLKRLANELAASRYNELPVPQKRVPGSEYVHYGVTFFDVAEDEALLIEMPDESAPGHRPYWSFQLYNLWNESTDAFHRTTSINRMQARIDPDGVLRIVIAQRDPGVPNWLDTDGQRRGYLWYRWIWADKVPSPTGRLVKLAELREHLPAFVPQIGEAQRREQRARRRVHLETRYFR